MARFSTRRSSGLGALGGCGCSSTGCIAFVVVALLLGSTAAKYCLLHWIPALHASFPALTPLDPNVSVWSLKMMLIGVFGSELFIPGAIITWLLIGLGILH